MQKTIRMITFLFCTLPYACTERMENLATNKMKTQLVIFGEITTDTTSHKIRLTKTTNYYYTQPEPIISSAKVTLSDGDKDILLKESKEEPGTYLTPPDYYGEVGKTYSIVINNIDINKDKIPDQYKASSTIPPVSKIDTVMVRYSRTLERWMVQLFATEPNKTRDFYTFKVRVNGKLLSDSIDNIIFGDDEFFNGSKANGSWVQEIKKRKGEIVNTGDTITLEMAGVPEGFYNFIKEYQKESGFRDPMFSGPPANIKTNINNGAIGYFAAYSITRKNTIFDGKSSKK